MGKTLDTEAALQYLLEHSSVAQRLRVEGRCRGTSDLREIVAMTIDLASDVEHGQPVRCVHNNTSESGCDWCRIYTESHPSYDKDDSPEVESDVLDTQEFYELMQAYRHTPLTNQSATADAFEDVKRFLRKELGEPLAVAKEFIAEHIGVEPEIEHDKGD